MAARGRNTPHRKAAEDEAEEVSEAIPKVSLDYFFFNKRDERASEHPVLIMTDEEPRDKYARATGKKGLGDGDEMDWLVL